MKHLNPQIQKKQEEFLEHCPEEERELHFDVVPDRKRNIPVSSTF